MFVYIVNYTFISLQIWIYRSCIEDEEVPKASAKITQERREKFALSNCTPSILVDDSNGNTSTPQDSS